ncbi:hypothetical protein EVG20_g10622 [Dentipellis fragilis]|uniref:F-box domain-containing protein n=1 Tax=Dentipellis fragilis TaxID=205917 RepID=A0A4Y9XR83_9AGAM|nr:hypothetical protein EVG20_g10622 [Dentipellis fragilis]
MSVAQDDPALCLSALEFWHDVEKRRLAQIICTMHSRDTSPLRPSHFADADVRIRIGHEMDAVVRMLYSLRFYYNSLAPVNRLPPEVLTRVFSFLQVLDPPRNLDHAKRAVPYNIGWLRVTHICRQWRIAALGYPRLWSNIRVSLGTNWMNTFLHRAQMAPIVFSTAGLSVTERHSDVASTLASNLCRMRELRVSALTSAELAAVFWTLDTAAPVLEKASLRTTVSYWDFALMESGMPALPANLFNSAAPRLRELRISGFSAFWLSIPFRSLVSLNVDNYFRNDGQGASDSQLRDFDACLGALAGMSMLESLRLKYALPELSLGAAFHALPTITLPYVRKFSLSDHVLECAVALQHISTPALKEGDMHVRCTVNTAAGRGVDLIHPWIISRLPAISSICSGSTSIYCWEGGFTLCVSDHCTSSPALEKIGADADSVNSEPGPFYAPAMGTPFLQLSLDGFADTEAAIEIRNTIGLLPPGCLESLKLSGRRAFRVESQYWIVAFGGCDAVRHVTLVGNFAGAFIQIQAATREHLFATVDSVTLQDLDFTVEELILDLQIAWHNETARIVYLLRCRISREVREWMVRRVPRVFWDGVSDSGRWNSENDDDEDGGKDGEEEDEDGAD